MTVKASCSCPTHFPQCQQPFLRATASTGRYCWGAY